MALPNISSSSTSQRVFIIGIDITHLPGWLQFCILSIGVFVFYLGYGYMQELIFQLDGMKPFGWYLTLVQFIIYSMYAFAIQKLCYTGSRKIPLNTYTQLAFYTVATVGFSNASVGYLNYPTQVIFKCCKLIPVLIGGIIIQGKQYNMLDFASAALMSLGLTIFTLADSEVSPNFNVWGYAMISFALLADAIIGNVQEKAMRNYEASNNEVVLHSYTIGCLYILVLTLVTGQLFSGFFFFLKHPLQTYGYALIFSTFGFVGVSVVLSLVRTSGAFLAVTVTTVRKTITIALSFVLFTKPFTMNYLLGGSIVFLAVYINVYNKNRLQLNEALIACLKRLKRKKHYEEQLL